MNPFKFILELNSQSVNGGRKMSNIVCPNRCACDVHADTGLKVMGYLDRTSASQRMDCTITLYSEMGQRLAYYAGIRMLNNRFYDIELYSIPRERVTIYVDEEYFVDETHFKFVRQSCIHAKVEKMKM